MLKQKVLICVLCSVERGGPVNPFLAQNLITMSHDRYALPRGHWNGDWQASGWTSPTTTRKPSTTVCGVVVILLAAGWRHHAVADSWRQLWADQRMSALAPL